MKSFRDVRPATGNRATSTAEAVGRVKSQLENSRIGIIETVEEFCSDAGARSPMLDLLGLFHSYVGVCAHLEKLAENGVPDAASRLPKFAYLNDLLYSLDAVITLVSGVGQFNDWAENHEAALNLIDEVTGDLTPSNC